MSSIFRKLAVAVSLVAGKPQAFLVALIIIVIWLVSGPVFGYSDTWQLVINTATTIVTFLMVFLIQNTQNRDSKAIHLKLDELVKTQRGASNKFVNVEEMSDEELEELHSEAQMLHDKYMRALEKRRK